MFWTEAEFRPCWRCAAMMQSPAFHGAMADSPLPAVALSPCDVEEKKSAKVAAVSSPASPPFGLRAAVTAAIAVAAPLILDAQQAELRRLARPAGGRHEREAEVEVARQRVGARVGSLRPGEQREQGEGPHLRRRFSTGASQPHFDT